MSLSVKAIPYTEHAGSLVQQGSRMPLGFIPIQDQFKKREKKIEHALAAAETITGLIHAYALIRRSRLDGMKVSRLKKKFKDKNFAAGVNRDIILECEKIGIPLDEFMQISIEAMKKIANEVGLG